MVVRGDIGGLEGVTISVGDEATLAARRNRYVQATTGPLDLALVLVVRGMDVARQVASLGL